MKEYICEEHPDIAGWSTVKKIQELIRCKDCIHRYSTCPMITIHPTGSITFRAQDDWFCFMGERKEE